MTSFKPSAQIGVGGLVLTGREKGYVAEVMASARLSYGAMTERLEREFARAHDAAFAAFCNSGTSALHIALQALKIRHGWADGDEVIVPALTFVATANIVLHNRMTPVFVDIEPGTFGMDPARLERALTPRTRALLPVHLFGQPATMDPILAVARAHGLEVLEDSCETMFARYRGRSVGSMGAIGCFSTYVAHLLVTGVGGFAVTSDPELAVLLKSLMNHGRDSIYLSIDADKDTSAEHLRDIVARRFSFVHPGHSFRATELEAAIGLGQLEQKDELMARRRANAAQLNGALADLAEHLTLPVQAPDRDHVYMMYPLLARPGVKRDLVNFLEERLIETRDLMPLLSQPAIQAACGVRLEDYPVARRAEEDGFYIGCHPYLSAEELAYMVSTLHDFFGRRR